MVNKAAENVPVKIDIQKLRVSYGDKIAVRDVSMAIPANKVTALIGPSGCGKSTLLRALNRMNDIIPNARAEGQINIDGKCIINDDIDVVDLRRRVGMVFQKPNPFPKSIQDNVAYGPRIHGARDKKYLRDTIERALIRAGLWDEVKDRLKDSAMALSGGQQQRLCIARALAVNPEILLMDEPTSALDPKATAHIEKLMEELRKDYTIIIVTHNMHQAHRISDMTGFLLSGRLVEFADTKKIFGAPREEETEAYVAGLFG